MHTSEKHTYSGGLHEPAEGKRPHGEKAKIATLNI